MIKEILPFSPAMSAATDRPRARRLTSTSTLPSRISATFKSLSILPRSELSILSTVDTTAPFLRTRRSKWPFRVPPPMKDLISFTLRRPFSRTIWALRSLSASRGMRKRLALIMMCASAFFSTFSVNGLEWNALFPAASADPFFIPLLLFFLDKKGRRSSF